MHTAYEQHSSAPPHHTLSSAVNLINIFDSDQRECVSLCVCVQMYGAVGCDASRVHNNNNNNKTTRTAQRWLAWGWARERRQKYVWYTYVRRACWSHVICERVCVYMGNILTGIFCAFIFQTLKFIVAFKANAHTRSCIIFHYICMFAAVAHVGTTGRYTHSCARVATRYIFVCVRVCLCVYLLQST